jgi:hypothetical protein
MQETLEPVIRHLDGKKPYPRGTVTNRLLDGLVGETLDGE